MLLSAFPPQNPLSNSTPPLTTPYPPLLPRYLLQSSSNSNCSRFFPEATVTHSHQRRRYLLHYSPAREWNVLRRRWRGRRRQYGYFGVSCCCGDTECFDVTGGVRSDD
ncbi:hypothetical protein KY285_023310 [Solanum tuberosum]|nr:hypothetical protein KY289_023645 [Solanum tuberosum]KAH0675509.1 hypothetical protein KY285_023310 [Solanum tuberosum]